METITINAAELALIIDALRMKQRDMDTGMERYTADVIDSLCERLNFADVIKVKAKKGELSAEKKTSGKAHARGR